MGSGGREGGRGGALSPSLFSHPLLRAPPGPGEKLSASDSHGPWAGAGKVGQRRFPLEKPGAGNTEPRSRTGFLTWEPPSFQPTAVSSKTLSPSGPAFHLCCSKPGGPGWGVCCQLPCCSLIHPCLLRSQLRAPRCLWSTPGFSFLVSDGFSLPNPLPSTRSYGSLCLNGS